MTESERDLHQKETLRLYFDAFQHMATLNTAAGLVVVAVFRDSTVPDLVVFASLGGMVISLLSSLWGMYRVTTQRQSEDRNLSDMLAGLRWILGTSLLMFGLGLIIVTGFFVATG